jgi:protein-S-isoprenylcysteine O-methyltransferase Ste14
MTENIELITEADDKDTRKGVTRWLIREIMGGLFSGLIVFIAAGRFDLVWGWVLMGVYLSWTAATAIVLIPRCPELLAERATRSKSMKTWDARLMSLIGLLTLAKYVLAGLDLRFAWTGGIPIAAHLTALVIAASTFALVTWSMAANAFFSLIVRIQDDRQHAVADNGPYRYVRHPGYIGALVFELASPILLGSLWALIPGVVAALLFILRTALEDRTLHEELPGYTEFAQRTRYRLLPGVW